MNRARVEYISELNRCFYVGGYSYWMTVYSIDQFHICFNIYQMSIYIIRFTTNYIVGLYIDGMMVI